MSWKIYTKRGDKGETGLLYGGRVSKADPRCQAYGNSDEAVSALGMARALSKNQRTRDILKKVQRDLFTLGAELATDSGEYAKLKLHFSLVTPKMVSDLESVIDALNKEIKLPRAFIIPGASASSSALDLARTILRRTERSVVILKERGLLYNEEVLRYLNRLADLIFVLARYEDRELPFEVLTGDDT